MTVQADLCQTCLETTLLVFPRGRSNVSSNRKPKFLSRKSTKMQEIIGPLRAGSHFLFEPKNVKYFATSKINKHSKKEHFPI